MTDDPVEQLRQSALDRSSAQRPLAPAPACPAETILGGDLVSDMVAVEKQDEQAVAPQGGHFDRFAQAARLTPQGGRVGWLDGDVLEGRHRLRDAVFQELEIAWRQAGDAAAVEQRIDVESNEVGGGPEGRAPGVLAALIERRT